MKNKSINIVLKIIIITISILIFMLLGNSSVNAANTTHGFISRNGSVNLSSAKSVLVNQQGTDYCSYCTSGCARCLTLNQYNVFCGQHGKNIQNAWYSVSEEYTAQDQGLAYILYNGTRAGAASSLESTWENGWQKILWAYLYDNKDSGKDDFDNIVGGTSPKDCTEGRTYTAYNTAKGLVNKNKNFDPGISIVDNASENLTIKVKGCDGEYKFSIKRDGGSWSTSTKNVSEFTVSKNSSTNIEVKVTDTIDKYIVKYRVLKNTRGQRLIVVTETGTETAQKSDEADWVGKRDISLQKYIVAVGSTFTSNTLSNVTYDSTARKNLKATNESKTAISKTLTSGSDIKSENPIEIKNNDYVVYRISVYNNEDEAATAWVKDRISKEYAELIGVYDSHDGLQYKNKRNDIDNFKNDDDKYNYYKWQANIPAGGSNAFFVVLKYKTFTTDIIENKAYINNNNETTYRKQDYDYVIMTTNTSIQKYIVAVGAKFEDELGDDGQLYGALSDISYNYSNDRKLRRAKNREAVDGSTEYIEKLYSESNSANSVYSGYLASDNYKREDPVEITNGDYVVYKVEVYNNDSVDAVIRVKDRMSIYGEIIAIYRNHVTGEKHKFNNRIDNLGAPYQNDGDEGRYYRYNWKAKVTANSYNAFWVVIQYKDKIDETNPENSIYVPEEQLIGNKAYINETYNKTEYNTGDEDYVILRNHAVSLEKFVSKVESSDGTLKENYADSRKNMRYNENAADKTNSENYNTWKKNNPVPVETGDIITYTIRLKNTGKAPVRITQIYDSFRFNEEDGHNENGLKLHWVDKITDESGNEIKVVRNGDNICGKVIDENYTDPTDTNKKRDIYLIELDNIELEKNKSIDITIKFRAEVPYDITDRENISIPNRAAVVEITNKSGKTVVDKDGTDNNEDKDLLKPQIYKVSLEKFVSSVTDINGNEIKNERVKDETGKNIRINHRHNENLEDGNANKDTYKKENDNTVLVDIGDNVTFTIRIKNEGTTKARISQISDSFTNDGTTNVKLIYDDSYGVKWQNNTNSGVGVYNSETSIIDLNNVPLLGKNGDPDDYIDITMRFKVSVPPELSNVEQEFNNKANIVLDSLVNSNGEKVKDSDGEDNNYDKDWVKTRTYCVSLEKYISQVNGSNLKDDQAKREDLPEHNRDDKTDTNELFKYNNMVVVSKGDKVTYRIIVKNDGNSPVYISEITDYIPNGMKYLGKDYTGSEYCDKFDYGDTETAKDGKVEENAIKFTSLSSEIIEPGTTASFAVELEVIEPDSSNNTLRNVAEITGIKNKNDIDIIDSTINDNRDSDFVELDFKPDDPKVVDINVVKVWEDKENVAGKRPSSIETQLMKNGTAVPAEEDGIRKLEDSNGWKGVWEKLPELDGDGKKIEYTVKEIELPEGYSSTVKEEGNTIIITNKLEESEETTYIVNKEWQDENNKFGRRPAVVKVQLYKLNADGSETPEKEVVELKEESGWTYTWTGLEKGAIYTAKEIEVPDGYQESYRQEVNTMKITNTYSEEPDDDTIYTVRKLWNHGNEEDGENPEENWPTKVMVQLIKEETDGTSTKVGAEVELNESNGWTHTWTELEKGATYKAEEIGIPEGYQVGYQHLDGITTITNSYEVDKPEYTTFTVLKDWEHNTNPEENWPTKIMVQLLKVEEDGTKIKVGSEEELNEANGWTHTWEELDPESNYTVQEIFEKGKYHSTSVISGNKAVITNTYKEEPDKTQYTVEKQWNHNENTEIPTQIKVQLLKLESDGTTTKVGEEELNDSNEWKHTWTGLNSTATYKVEEVELPIGYIVNYSHNASENKTVITNTYDGGTNYFVEKKWVGDTEGERPESINVQLMRDGAKYEGEVTLNASMNWRYEWTGLPTCDASGHKYTYSVIETTVTPEYTPTYNPSGNSMVIINTKQASISKAVTKQWLDTDGNIITAPEEIEISVELYRDFVLYDTIKLNKDNNWAYKWSNLPKTNTSTGIDYKYTVQEIGCPEGYTPNIMECVESEYVMKDFERDAEGKTVIGADGLPIPKDVVVKIEEGFLIQNKKINYVSKTVIKEWDDDNNSAGKRPSEVKIQLYKNGVKVEDNDANPEFDGIIILNEANNWEYTWNNLNGESEYDVQEFGIADYKEIENYKINDNFIIVNKYEPGTTPPPIDPPPIIPPHPGVSAIISGYVWNDLAVGKTKDIYDGAYNISDGEEKLSGINVKLYRQGVALPVAETVTVGGHYWFNNESLSPIVLPNENERFIKGPKIDGIWTGLYYSYYIVFEYDGITYTSTVIQDTSEESVLGIKNEAKNDSTAMEENGYLASNALESRDTFNAKFSTINNATELTNGILYTTKNENGYIPESHHIYNPLKMSMKSSTNLVNIADFAGYEDCLKEVNFGLRGKNIFDLEIASDVYNIDVEINGKKNVYKYSNKVTLSRGNLLENNYYEDMANKYSQEGEYNYTNDQQKLSVRKTDTLAKVYVTYKITVKNTSKTLGTATKIINYYDDVYKFEKAYDSNGELTSTPGEVGTGFKSQVITTSGGHLDESNKMEIFVVYELEDMSSVNGLSAGNSMPTYNMAEIYEYKTFDKVEDGKSDKATRGLLDKDSAPGSANDEKARTTDNEGISTPTLLGNPSTVKYYFNSSEADLNKLKYEDDTYATPTLYFVKDNGDQDRRITGYVFEDSTVVDSGTKIKTGNAKLDADEFGIFGAEVELRDLSDNIIATAITDKDGYFELKGFAPGKYKIRYWYGNNEQTALIGRSPDTRADGTPINKTSYNGEDFEATNNFEYYKVNDGLKEIEVSILNNITDLWYVYNEYEGISTARDDGNRRNTVSNNILTFNTAKMESFNNLRDVTKYPISDLGDIMDKTYMFAETKEFDVAIEKLEIIDRIPEGYELVENGTINDMGDGIGQWAIFPDASSSLYKSYTITNMNFGIARIPVTVVDLEKYVSALTIKDSSGAKVLASAKLKLEGGKNKIVYRSGAWVLVDEHGAEITDKWDIDGEVLIVPPDPVLYPSGKIDVSIEEDKLQGAKLEITYNIARYSEMEKHYDKGSTPVPAKGNITGIVDFVSNNLSYNSELGNNSHYWEIIDYATLNTELASLQSLYPSGITVESTVTDSETDYITLLKLKPTSRFLNITEGQEEVSITLEKVLTSTDAILGTVISEISDDSEYTNQVEITGWEYAMEDLTGPGGVGGPDGVPETPIGIDRIRTADSKIILPGVQNDYAISETIVIHPPTGDNFNVTYLVIAIVSLIILAAGVFGIKKFVIKK